jgi:hypothetical protein
VDTNDKNSQSRRTLFEGIKDYFNKEKIDHAKSGVLSLIVALKKFAEQSKTDFDLLLELISENKVSQIGDKASVVDDILDWIDDTLLSLLLLNNPEGNIDVGWVEGFFCKSLAYIQASSATEIRPEQLIDFIKSRTMAVANKVGDDRSKWNSIVKSGIPLNSDLILEDKIDALIEVTDTYLLFGDGIGAKIDLLKDVENIIEGLPVLNEEAKYLDYPQINNIREKWLKGVSTGSIIKIPNGLDVISDVYSFSLPWVLNGIAKNEGA